jgi:hypothetical protein
VGGGVIAVHGFEVSLHVYFISMYKFAYRLAAHAIRQIKFIIFWAKRQQESLTNFPVLPCRFFPAFQQSGDFCSSPGPA